jgi:hypothetical protein
MDCRKIFRACDCLDSLRDEKDLVRGLPSRAMRRVRVAAPRDTHTQLSRGISVFQMS